MQAGRQLDALVAEKVMEWPNAADWGENYYIPQFSTDIAAAWEVLERLLDLGYKVKLVQDFGGIVYKWHVEFEDVDSYGFAEGLPAPHAICLAALDAVGVEVPDDA